jgi:multiple sugar transport system substrate-binding protein
VKLTIIPNDSYLQKVGAAAGSRALPDLLAADVVYAPNYVKQGLLRDITATVKALPAYGKLAKAHLDAASRDGKTFAVPHKVDSSLIFYNKDLYTKAGLDPQKPPRTFAELYAHAKAIRALGGDTYGFYWGGNCPGCNAYTMFPYAVAAGRPPLAADGTKADIDNPAFAETMALYKRLTDEGIAPSSVKTEDGATWTASFLAGKVGIFPAGSFVFPEAIAKAKFDWGVTPLMAPDGSRTATFVGGDVLGVSSSAKQPDAALDFLTWTLGDGAQVDIIAKNGDLTARTDLAGNQYSGKDARVKATIEGLTNGYTPTALPYGELFNDANGPWNQAIRGAVFAGDPAKSLADAQAKVQAKLSSAG